MTDDQERQERPMPLIGLRPGTDVVVGYATPPDRIAQYQAAGLNLVNIDEEIEAKALGIDPETNPEAYRQLGSASRNVWAAAAAAPRTPTHMEVPPRTIIDTGTGIEVNRFSLTPGGDIYRQQLPGAKFAYSEPSMFTSGGPLPAITGSGVDPSWLKMCAWYLRHSAAYTERRSLVLSIIEESMDQDADPDLLRLQTSEGTDALRSYLTKIGYWVTTPPDPEYATLDYEALENDANLFPPQQQT